jgi:hypothetical protein
MSKREEGVVTSVFVGKEDHGIETCYVMLNFGGSCQGFGGVALQTKKIQKSFVSDLCKAFGVKTHEDLVGKKCFALRCWETWNEPIEGLEAEDGKRFTLTGWRKKMGFPSDRLEAQKESLQAEIRCAARRIERCQQELATLEQNFTSWE